MLIEDLEQVSYKLINRLFPFISDYKLTPEHRALDANLNTLWDSLEEFLLTSTDSDSVYHRIIGG
jgi:hypothetical protein